VDVLLPSESSVEVLNLELQFIISPILEIEVLGLTSKQVKHMILFALINLLYVQWRPAITSIAPLLDLGRDGEAHVFEGVDADDIIPSGYVSSQ